MSVSPKVVCREVPNSKGDPPVLYLLVTWRKSSFDIRATDGRSAWEASGCECPANTIVGEAEWLRNTELALVGGSCEDYEYEAEIMAQSGLDFKWFWVMKGVGGETRAMGRCVMSSVAGAQEVVQGILTLACGSFACVKMTLERALEEKQVVESRLKVVEETMKERIMWWERREETMLQKSAELVNECRAQVARMEEASGQGRKREKGDSESESDPYEAVTEEDSDDDPISPPTGVPAEDAQESHQVAKKTAPIRGEGISNVPEDDFMEMDTQPIDKDTFSKQKQRSRKPQKAAAPRVRARPPKQKP